MVPILPIIMAVSALGAGIAQGVSQARQAKSEAQAVQAQAITQMNERVKKARTLMSQQKNSFLKGGVYFDTGSPLSVINETYDVMDADIGAMKKDTDIKVNNLMRQGKTAFYNSVMQGVMNAGMAFGGAKGAGGLGTDLVSKVGSTATNWYNKKRGWSVGDFNTSGSTTIV